MTQGWGLFYLRFPEGSGCMRRVFIPTKPAPATFTVISVSKCLPAFGVACKSTQASESIRRELTPGPASSSDLTSLRISFPFWKMKVVRPRCAGLGAHVLESGCLTLLLPGCSLLSKFLNLAVPQCPHLSKQRLGEDLSVGAGTEIKLVNPVYVKCLESTQQKISAFYLLLLLLIIITTCLREFEGNQMRQMHMKALSANGKCTVFTQIGVLTFIFKTLRGGRLDGSVS